ncbi:hypothetical protein I2I05_12580 [Hymenobacter sp. BT683]|uniref:Tetratricopeptide repeat protein n=1 Tax=Hymenobacter jeongseonensis TaxID=2791027 RepID=A0ABS0IIN8_9BACT|nr:hypothetical protein [Hymenobacter jeongseonensis]MBF9238232.1 hypothetical protein [Hymenobacter jeongseonensis]
MAHPISKRLGLPGWLAILAALAVGVAVFYYFTGDAATLPVQVVPHLQAVPVVVEQVVVGAVRLPVQASGFVVSLTHDVAGPFTQPVAAGLFLVLLAFALAGWVAVASTLPRAAFLAGMVPVIFLLMALNLDVVGVFEPGKRYFLYMTLGLLVGGAYGLHAFAQGLRLGWRWLIFGTLVAGLSALLYLKSDLSPAETTLQLAAYATTSGAVMVALVVLWVGIENIRALLWFNTQAEQPSSRFGLAPFVLASSLYLGALWWLVWNNGKLQLFPGVQLDPLVLLLPALLASGLGLRLRAPSYAEWVPYSRAAQLYALLLLPAAGALGYAFATANTPLLRAARDFTSFALLFLGGAFLAYVLMNFAPLIRQRLRVYRVVFEPRRLPFYPVYILAVGALIMVQVRNNRPLPDQVAAGEYNNLGDLTRQQSEANPNDVGLALLAERYYAEAGDVLYRGDLHAQMGRAALYRFRQQRQNEINALRRALLREPSEKVSLRLAALFTEPTDLFEGLEVLRRGLVAQPRSAAMAGDLAQLFTQTSLTDSVAYYLDKTEQLAPGSYPSQTNQLGFLLSQNLLDEARKLSSQLQVKADEPGLASNYLLLQLLTAKPIQAPAVPSTDVLVLDAASFAQLYHQVLVNVAQRKDQLTPALLQRLSTLANHPANENFYEQLLFLQALARHGRGEEQTARQLLAPLATGTNASAAYYQQLLGLWQLQQGQYARAATQFAFAAKNGAATALETRVLALAWSGQADSAQAAVARLVASPDSAERQAGRQAQKLLAAGNMIPATDNSARIGSKWLADALQAEQQKNTAEATRNYRRIVREAPFNEAAMLAAATFYTRRRDPVAAYEALRAGLDENPRSLPLLRNYVLAAADAGLTDYAADALVELRQQLSPAAYATLAAEYTARQAARAAAAASFSGAPATSPLQ